MSILLMRIVTPTTSVVVAETALGIIPSRKGILRILRPTAAAATEKGNKKDATQVDPHAAASSTAEEEEALLTSEFYEGISVKVELMLSSDDEDADIGEERASNKVQTESAGEANSKAETAINSICGAPGAGRATSAANGRQQQLWTVKDKKLSLVIVKSAASGSGDDERCNHRSGIIGSECEREPPPSPSPPPQSSRECSDHSGHLHCYRSNLVGGGGDSTGDKRNAVEKVTVGVSANGGERKAKKRRKKKRRRGRNKCDGGGGYDEECEGRRRATTSVSSSRSMSAFSSFISRTHSRRWMTGRRGSAGSADQQKSYMMSNNGGVTTLRMNFSAAAADGRTMSHTPVRLT